MARKKQVFSDKGVAVKNARAWINQWNKANGRIKFNQAYGNKTGYTY